MFNDKELDEVLDRDENHIDDLISVIQRYIYDRKKVVVNINYNQHPFFFINNDFKLIIYAYDQAFKWYKENKL